MIAATLLLAAVVTAAVPAPPPLVQTIAVPQGNVPTEIAQHGGALWFIAWHNWPKLEPYLGRISINGTIRLSEMLNGSMPGLTAHRDDGTLWMTDGRRDILWQVQRNGQLMRVRVDRPTLSIAFAPDGTAWCTHPNSSSISNYGIEGKLLGRWEVPALKKVPSHPSWITTGPDGNLWFSDPATQRIGRITTTGKITLFPLPKAWRDPGEIVSHEGGLWFAVANQTLLGRVTTKGVFSSVKIHAPAKAVAPDADHRMWYSDGGAGVGWIEPDGTTDYVLVTEAPSSVRSIAAGPDGAMWFVNEKARTIGRIELPKK